MAGLQRLVSGKPMLSSAANWKSLAVCQNSLKGSHQILESGKRNSSSTSSDEFLHPTSVVPTMHFQPSLPRLPIPKLQDTCDRYLRSQRPELDDNNFAKTSKIVQDFLEGKGKELHEELVAKDKKNKHTSYISGPWFDMYLEARVPIVLNHNPFMTFNMDPRPEYNDQVVRSTNFIVSAVRWMKTIRAGILEPEIYHMNPAKSDTWMFHNIARMVPSSLSWYVAYLYKAFPLDMSQYKRLFNSTRIPRQQKDELYSDPSARHIVVMRNGHFYVFNVIFADGHIVPATEIQAHLQYILSDNTPPPEHGVGVLTTENRDTWASMRSQLEEAGNVDTLKLIDSAVFCLCLEDSEPGFDPETLGRLKLHGDGYNRWFDKSFQLIVCKDGISSINMEHAWGDGVAVVRFMKDAFEECIKKPALAPGTPPAKVDSSHAVKKLEWHLTPAIKEGIDAAMKKFQQSTSSLRINSLEDKNMTKAIFKKCKVSPDSMMQLSFQMAYYRLTGGTAATYESCSTAAFKHGRTETLRSATVETKNCSEAFSQSGVSNDEKRALLMACSNKHNELTKEAAMGQGWDRHLFAMRHLANSHGHALDMFEDPAYKSINHIILSTSTLSNPAIHFGAFAPVVSNGLGIGYQIGDDRCGCVVTSYPDSPNANEFVDNVGTSLKDIYRVLSDTK